MLGKSLSFFLHICTLLHPLRQVKLLTCPTPYLFLSKWEVLVHLISLDGEEEATFITWVYSYLYRSSVPNIKGPTAVRAVADLDSPCGGLSQGLDRKPV